MTKNHRHTKTRNVIVITAITNILLAVLKVVFGFIGHSQALIADGIHSFSDLITDALVYFASRFGSRDADIEHPYGHARIETVATVGLAFVVILAGLGIAIDAGYDIFFEKSFATPDKFVLIVAAISIVANEGLFRYSLKVGNKIDSNLLRANAWHNRSDAASSLVVLVGVTGAILGFPFLDALAAFIVGFMIIKMGWSFGWKSIRELIDTGLSKEELQNVREVITNVPGVKSLHQLRTRSMGGRIFADVHILVEPFLTVSEGHYIGEQVHLNLLKKVEKIVDVTVHVDPENDEIAHPSVSLPPRKIIEPKLKTLWKDLPGVNEIQQMRLHYLFGKIYIEIGLPKNFVDSNSIDIKTLTEDYYKAAEILGYIGSIKIYLL